MILSPYQPYQFDEELDRLSDERGYFDLYDDLPASLSWMHSMGSSLGKAFDIKVIPGMKNWEIDFKKQEMRAGSIDDIYTRRGVLGLLLNGIGRLAFGIKFPNTKKDAGSFARTHGVKPELAKHFGVLARIVDEIRTDDKIAKEYAGGTRVVDTMHSQAYEGATEQLRLMAMDIKARRQVAAENLLWFAGLMDLVEKVNKIGPKDTASADVQKLYKETKGLFNFPHHHAERFSMMWDAIEEELESPLLATAIGRRHAVVLMALYPEKTDAILKVLVRAYERNIAIIGEILSYAMVTANEEAELIKLAAKVHPEFEDMKALASHDGGHAQYVLAKAEQFYHGYALGISMATPYFGYDLEAKALDVEAANESAREIARALADRGLTENVADSIIFAKELLPLVEKYPFLDVNDQKESKGNGTMSQRTMGAGKGTGKRKRQKEREKKSSEARSKDRRKMESIDNEKNQKEVDEQRTGYSILDKKNIDPLRKYLYIIGPYLNRISATAAKMRRILKVNDPQGFRGAYRRGKKLNPKVLYRHRIDDPKLFSRKERDKDLKYGFVLMGDISGSTEQRYDPKHNRLIEDEILASAFIITEVAERIGEKIMCAVGFFTNEARTIKRSGFYLNRGEIITKIKEHGEGTNVADAGEAIAEDLQELQEFKVDNKTIVFITDGCFMREEFLPTVKAAKKYNASIAYFQIMNDVEYGVQMCKEIENFVQENAKGVKCRTRNLTTGAINTLPEAIAQLMKETVSTRS